MTTLYAIDRRKDAFRFMKVNPSRYPAEWSFSDHKPLPSFSDLDKGDSFLLYMRRPDKWNVIMERIETDVIELAQELIEKGADIHLADGMGRSVLWHACAMSWLKSIPWLAGMGLNINDRDKDGNSVFDAGCLCGESLTIEPMIKAGALIDNRDNEGNTTLIKCGRRWLENPHGYAFSAVIALLHHGADPDMENNSGESLCNLAERDENLKWAIKHAGEE